MGTEFSFNCSASLPVADGMRPKGSPGDKQLLFAFMLRNGLALVDDGFAHEPFVKGQGWRFKNLMRALLKVVLPEDQQERLL